MSLKFTAAALMATGMAIQITPARADNFGCTVMLCLSGNWRSVQECVPPVRRALRKMVRSGWRPSCGLASGDGDIGAGNYMETHHETYISCTESYGAGYQDAYFDRSRVLKYGTGSGVGFLGSNSGPQCAKEVSRTPWANGRRPADTANYCVDETTTSRSGNRGSLGTYGGNKVRVCTDVQAKAKHPSPDFFDVYVDGQLYNRTYWTEDDAAPDEEVTTEGE